MWLNPKGNQRNRRGLVCRGDRYLPLLDRGLGSSYGGEEGVAKFERQPTQLEGTGLTRGSVSDLVGSRIGIQFTAVKRVWRERRCSWRDRS